MAKKVARKRTKPAPTGRWPVTAVKLVLSAGIAVAVIVGVGWLGRRAGEGLTPRDRYTVRLSDLKFDTPPHLDPKLFLTEVRYLGNLPDTVQSIDPALSDKLSTAFRKHPWVAGVSAVTVSADNTVQVQLQYRVPVLAVRWVQGAERETAAVDAAGVILPSGAPMNGLPVLVNERTGPKSEAGKLCLDADVRRAADLVSRHTAKAIERTKTGWKITEPDGKEVNITAP